MQPSYILPDKDIVMVTKPMMINMARSCVRSMEILDKDHNTSDWHLPFYLLAFTALESFGKLIFLENRKHELTGPDIILKEFRNISHQLDVLYSKPQVDDQFLNTSNITRVKRESGYLIFHYKFYVSEKDPVLIYHPESLRYGLLAKEKSNAGFIAFQFPEVLQLCRDVELAVISGAINK